MSLFTGLGRLLRRSLSRQSDQWPFLSGDYSVVDAAAPVVVAGVLQDSVAKQLAENAPEGLCMIAPLRTAADVADLLRALTTNPAVRSVICAGNHTPKQPLGSALLMLGCGDETPAGPIGTLMSAIAARIGPADLAALRLRVQFVDLLGCGESAKIAARIEASATAARPIKDGVERLVVPKDVSYEARPDKAGDFRIRIEEQSIVVDHLNSKERLLRVLEGKTARDICLALIRNGWVSRLDHAAYLGRELARAELALRADQRFTPDSVEPAKTLRPSATKH